MIINIQIPSDDYEKFVELLHKGSTSMFAFTEALPAEKEKYYNIIVDIIIQANQQKRLYEHSTATTNKPRANAKQTKRVVKPGK